MTGAPLLNAHPLRVVTVSTERRRPAGTNHLIATLMAFLLLFKTLTESIHQLVEPAKRLDFGLILIGEQTFKFAAHPVGRNVGVFKQARQRVDTFKIRGERLIKLIVMLLVFDKTKTRESIKFVEISERHVRSYCFDEIKVLADRARHSCFTDRLKEINEHASAPTSAHEGKLLKQVHVLFVFDQRSSHRRNSFGCFFVA